MRSIHQELLRRLQDKQEAVQELKDALVQEWVKHLKELGELQEELEMVATMQELDKFKLQVGRCFQLSEIAGHDQLQGSSLSALTYLARWWRLAR